MIVRSKQLFTVYVFSTIKELPEETLLALTTSHRPHNNKELCERDNYNPETDLRLAGAGITIVKPGDYVWVVKDDWRGPRERLFGESKLKFESEYEEVT